MTDGAFSVTVAPIMDAWNFTGDNPRVPSRAELDALLQDVGDERISFGDGTVTLELTDTSFTATDTEFTLACACLTMTTLSITGGDEVTITSGSRSVTMSRDSLTLIDDSTASTTEETK